MRVVALVLLPLLAAAGCGSAAEGSGTVTVFAAVSLTDAFTEVAEAYEDAHPGSHVVLNLASSTQLAGQIVAGAPADVFASADEVQMQVVADAGLAVEPRLLLGNRMAIVVEAGNPLGVAGLADLADPDLVVVLAAPEVPAGRYARVVLQAAGVTVAPASEEATVRSVLSKVVLGEADAGIVYASDVVAAGADATGIEIPADVDAVVRYPISVVKGAPNPDGAAAFVEFAASATADAVFLYHGFTRP